MKRLKLFFACLLMAVLSIGQVWGAEQVAYTLEPASTGGNSSPHNSYTAAATTTIDGIEWSVLGNSNMTPWRLGGKGSNCSGADRDVHSNTAISDNISKIVITHGTADNITVNSMTVIVSKNSDFSNPVSTLTPEFVASDDVTVNRPDGKDWSNCYYKIVYNVTVTGDKNKFVQFSGAVFYKESGSTPTCSNPTFSPVAGAVVSGTTVTLTTSTEGADIYYTKGASPADPTTSSTKYTGPISITDATTIKAIAVKEGYNNSGIATAAYTIVTPLSTMDAIFDAATAAGSTATDVYIDFQNWVVSGAKGNTAYVTDGTKGFIIYYSGHGFNEGDILSGTGSFKLKLYSGAAEITAKNSGTITATPGGSATLNVLDADDIAALSGINTGSLIKISGAATATDVVAGIKLYKTIYPASSLPSLSVGANYNCTGVYVQYSETKEMMPRSADDIEQIITTYTVSYNNTPDHGTLTIKNGDDVVASESAVNENTVLTIEATPDEGYKLTEVTVNGSAYAESTLTLTENVTIAATFEENLAPLVTSYDLSEIGVVTSHLNGERVGDKVNLPTTAATCSKTFRGWTTKADFADGDESLESFYAPGAEITLAANNMFYAVYADAHVITPTDHALGSLTVGGTNGNTASEGYTYTSNKTNDKAGYTQDNGTKDADIVHLQIKAASQIINEEPSAIIVTAHLGAGANRDELTYPVNAVLVDADGNNVGDPVVLTNSIPDKNGDDFSANLPTANYANVRGVKISHMKEDGWNVRYYSMSFKYQTGGTTYDNYSTDCQAQVATPVIAGVSPSGVYTEAKEITITCATDGATIYYAVDSDEEPSTEYTGAFTVDTDGAHTVKAKAVKTDMVASEVASVSFTINLPVVLSTMDAIFAAATTAGTTAADANIQFNNWVVSGVSTNGKNVFVTDGTKGFIIFDNGGNMGFAVGDVLSGTVACKVQLFKGSAELTTLSAATEGLNIAKEGVVTPVAKAITALSGINTGAAVTINSVQFDGTNLSDGANEIKPFKSLFAYDDLTENSYYNVTGIYQQYDATKEILPRSAADIVEKTWLSPELSYTPASATITTNDDLPATTFANPHDLEVTFSGNNDAVATVNASTGEISLAGGTGTVVITASFAGDDIYAAGNATYTLTVEQYVPSDNVVIIAEYNNKFYAMTTNINNKTALAVEVEKDGDNIVVASQADKDAIQWARKASGDNFTFQDANNKYLKGASNGGDLTLSDAVCEWSWNATDEYYYIGTRSFIYRESANGFKNYATSNADGQDYSSIADVRVIDPANIVITSKVSAELAYDPASVSLTVGGDFTPATLTYATNFDGLAAVTYKSSNTDLATVNEAGEVSLVADATGTTTITATFAGNDNYLAGNASYTITVNEVGDNLDGNWVLASQADIKAGQKIIIMGANNDDIYTMGKQNANPNRAAVVSTLADGVLTPGKGTKVFTLVNAGDGKFAIQASNGNYLSSATSGTSNNLIEAANYENDNAKWAIAPTSVVAAAGSKKVMQYNSGSTLFSCYGSATQKQVNIYVNKKEIEGNVDAADIPTGSNVIMEDGAVLTVDAPKTLGDVKVSEQTVINVNKPLTVQTFTFATTIGGTGESGEANVDVANGGAIIADIYQMDVRLAPENSSTRPSGRWHAFTVPFPVDALNGVYDTLDNKLQNEVNYAIMSYHGDVRAQGLYGWKKFRGIMSPGTFYLLTVDGDEKVLRFKKTADGAVVASNNIVLTHHTGSGDATKDHGWNGVGNPNLFGGYAGANVQVLNDAGDGFVPYTPNEEKFAAGIPFFVKVSQDSAMSMAATPSSSVIARTRTDVIKNVKITFGNDAYMDKLYISASEDALNQYEEGKDLVKMTMSNTPSVAQIFGNAYGNKLCMVNAPMANDQAEYGLTLYAPNAGEYTISAPEMDNADIFLTYEGSIIWNLSMSDYTNNFAKGNNEGYGLILVKKAPQVVTGVDNAEANEAGVQKVIINKHVYILRAEQMYDVTGKMVK